jgi:putative endonuclease
MNLTSNQRPGGTKLTWWDRLWLRFGPGRSAKLGEKGEWAARRFLRRKGMAIVERSMRNAFGEIDLVAVDGRTVVFVEVKTRASDIAGEPAEAVDDDKQRRITSAALAYLRAHRLLNHAARFDVVTLIWSPDQAIPEIEHIENAFSPVGRNQMFG